jgi:hypothetical protein
LTFWTLSISLFLYLKQHFRDWRISPSSGKKPNRFGLIDRSGPQLRTPTPTQGRIYKVNTTSAGVKTNISKLHLRVEAEFSLQNVVLRRRKKNWMIGNAQKVNFIVLFCVHFILQEFSLSKRIVACSI